MPATALITGGTGFLGSHLVRSLVRNGDDVHVLVRPSSNFSRLRDLENQIRVHKLDTIDGPAVADLIREVRPENVFHLAGAGSIAGVAARPIDLIGINILGIVHLITACENLDYRCLVTSGDAFEYAPRARPLRETDECEPLSLHGITKLAATLHAKATAAAKGRPIVTLRLFSIYGPGDSPLRLIPRTVAGALSHQPVPLSRPDVTRDWIYVDDAVALYLEAARRAAGLAGEVFNVGTGYGTDLARVVDTVSNLTGSQTEARWGAFPTSVYDDYPWVADMRRTFETFAWRPHVTLEEGLQRVITTMSMEKSREAQTREGQSSVIV